MKYRQTIAVLLSAIVLTSCVSAVKYGHPALTSMNKNHLIDLKAGLDLCPTCISFSGQAINELLNIILNLGVVGSCEKICSLLEEKTGSQILGAVCNILCDIEGVKEFVKIIEKADLDPIYLCELLKACPVFDGGDATVTSIKVSPYSGPQGTRVIDVMWTSRNGTGTGELILFIRTVDGIPVEASYLEEPQQPGSYRKSFQLDAKPDPSCDPTQQPCEEWLPGNYTAIFEICNGECGSKHPHSKVYDKKEAPFVLT